MANPFIEIGIVIITAAIFACGAQVLRQPSIIAYILTGIILGPIGAGVVTDPDLIKLFSEFGIIFLLFIVGLQLDVKKLRDVARSSLAIGVCQLAMSGGIGYAIARLWFDHTSSLYLAVALSFASTVIVVKLLTDKNELSTLHGRIALGILIVQDIAAMLALAMFSSAGDSTSTFLFGIIKVMFVAGTIIVARYLVMPVVKFVASSVELLFLMGLSWAFLGTSLAYAFGVSTAIGAFVAGITLASTPYAIEMSARIRPLRDFFIITFFVSLGLQATFNMGTITPLILFLILIMIINPIIILVLTGLSGYHRRTSFLTSISFSQVSEFSLIIIALGASNANVSSDIVALVTALATISIMVSTYVMSHAGALYYCIKPLLMWHSEKEDELSFTPKQRYDVVLCGYNRMGYSILRKLHLLKKDVLVVDYNPDTIKHLIEINVPCMYGDVSDHEVIERMNLHDIKLLVSTVPSLEDNMLLLKKLKAVNRNALGVLAGEQIDDALQLYRAGADYVLIPHLIGGDHFALLVEDFNLQQLVKQKKLHIKELKKRKELGHDMHIQEQLSGDRRVYK